MAVARVRLSILQGLFLQGCPCAGKIQDPDYFKTWLHTWPLFLLEVALIRESRYMSLASPRSSGKAFEEDAWGNR